LRLDINKPEATRQAVHDLIPLSLLSPGQSGEIHAVAGVPEHARRLHELGFRQGVWVEMLRSGSPCIVRIDNSKLCFRDGEAFQVLVKPGQSS
jgi:ferrous iron transport protein A